MVNMSEYKYVDEPINPEYSAIVYTYPELFLKRETVQFSMMPVPEVVLSNILYSEISGQ